MCHRPPRRAGVCRPACGVSGTLTAAADNDSADPEAPPAAPAPTGRAPAENRRSDARGPAPRAEQGLLMPVGRKGLPERERRLSDTPGSAWSLRDAPGTHRPRVVGYPARPRGTTRAAYPPGRSKTGQAEA
ncbi:hypothetical protein GCM10009731_57780 [Streptomyces globosus]